ncbi:MAG TPA: helix-turn-helix transcriptional regulator [Jiangellaceae bacterium]|jgi:transcriptional regulator with XRE-family HTH domain|nr:helix-turn-helix transcriptional regulator [Jiangellaceae bacterium]
MPRPNRPRSIASEDNLARRIAHEREQRGWSYAGLAQRMTAQGCSIDQSALYKIEKGRPRRRISVDELVALSEVFAVPVHELLAPPELAAKKVVLEALQRHREALAALAVTEGELFELVKGDEQVQAALSEHLTLFDVPPIFLAEQMFFSGRSVSRDQWVGLLDALLDGLRRQGRADEANTWELIRDRVAAGESIGFTGRSESVG